MYKISYKIETCEESVYHYDYADSWESLLQKVSLSNVNGYKDIALVIRKKANYQSNGENKFNVLTSGGWVAVECSNCQGEGCESCDESGHHLADIEHITLEITINQSSKMKQTEMIFLQNFLNSSN